MQWTRAWTITPIKSKGQPKDNQHTITITARKASTNLISQLMVEAIHNKEMLADRMQSLMLVQEETKLSWKWRQRITKTSRIIWAIARLDEAETIWTPIEIRTVRIISRVLWAIIRRHLAKVRIWIRLEINKIRIIIININILRRAIMA